MFYLKKAGEYSMACLPSFFLVVYYICLQRICQSIQHVWICFWANFIMFICSPFIIWYFCYLFNYTAIGIAWAFDIYNCIPCIILTLYLICYAGRGNLFVYYGTEVFSLTESRKYVSLAMPSLLQL
eukprot:UN26009